MTAARYAWRWFSESIRSRFNYPNVGNHVATSERLFQVHLYPTQNQSTCDIERILRDTTSPPLSEDQYSATFPSSFAPTFWCHDCDLDQIVRVSSLLLPPCRPLGVQATHHVSGLHPLAHTTLPLVLDWPFLGGPPSASPDMASLASSPLFLYIVGYPLRSEMGTNIETSSTRGECWVPKPKEHANM